MTNFKRKEIVTDLLPLFCRFMKPLTFCILLLSTLITSPLSAADDRSRRSSEAVRNAPLVAERERAGSDYVLQPQDQIRVYVFQEEDINKQGEVGITNDYSITLPLIGTVSLRGKTVRQAEELIRQLYERDYLVNPTVAVTVLKYSDRSVNVTGAVNTAGRVQFPQERGLSIVDAITLAGGHSRLADLKKVKLTRKKADGDSDVEVVNVDAIMKGGARDVALDAGDAVFVPERIL